MDNEDYRDNIAEGDDWADEFAWHEDALKVTQAELAAGRIKILDWEDAKNLLRQRFKRG